MSHQYTTYWDRGVRNVPDMTGARELLDAQDLPQLATELGFELPLVDVLDVGCGTGRIAQHCTGYIGVDIAPSAIAYCAEHGIQADVISGADDISAMPATVQRMFGWVTCMSVFTHIDRPERLAYLRAFHGITNRLLVDIIPGNGSGDVAMWTADPDQFLQDLADTGFDVRATFHRDWPRGVAHRFHYAEAVRQSTPVVTKRSRTS